MFARTDNPQETEAELVAQLEPLTGTAEIAKVPLSDYLEDLISPNKEPGLD